MFAKQPKRCLRAALLCVCVMCGAGLTARLWGAEWKYWTDITIDDMTSATAKAAPDGTTPNTRLTIGLGEKVTCSIDSSTFKNKDCKKKDDGTWGDIVNDTIGDRVWAAAGAGTISPSGVTSQDSVTLTAAFDPGFCAVVVDVYDSESQYTNSYVLKSKVFTVIKPSGETTKDDGWNGSTSNFASTLTPKSVCFSAINITEKDGTGANDGCWYLGVPDTMQKYDHLMGPGFDWGILDTNAWSSDDSVSWNPTYITYYRTHPATPRAPCHTTVPQQMHVKEGSSGQYAGSDITLEIGTTTLTNTRNSKTMTRNYP